MSMGSRAELQQSLELACRERGYGPRFYRALLEGEIYALRPARARRVEDGIVRFVLWTDVDGKHVIPFFSSLDRVERVLTPDTEACALTGRRFLEAARGASVVLNPNEQYFCRLAPQEIGALLDTGAVSGPESERIPTETEVALAPVEKPPVALLHSLVILYAQHPEVVRAYLATALLGLGHREPVYLIVIELASGNGECVARESAAVMQDVPPDLATDLICLGAEDEMLKAVARVAAPFYDRALGTKLMEPTVSSM